MIRTPRLKRQLITQNFTEYLRSAEEIRVVLDDGGSAGPTTNGDATVVTRVKANPGNKDEDGDGHGEDREQTKLRAGLNSTIIHEKPNVKWSDVVGLESAKEALQEAVILLVKFPQFFTGTPGWAGVGVHHFLCRFEFIQIFSLMPCPSLQHNRFIQCELTDNHRSISDHFIMKGPRSYGEDLMEGDGNGKYWGRREPEGVKMRSLKGLEGESSRPNSYKKSYNDSSRSFGYEKSMEESWMSRKRTEHETDGGLERSRDSYNRVLPRRDRDISRKGFDRTETPRSNHESGYNRDGSDSAKLSPRRLHSVDRVRRSNNFSIRGGSKRDNY